MEKLWGTSRLRPKGHPGESIGSQHTCPTAAQAAIALAAGAASSAAAGAPAPRMGAIRAAHTCVIASAAEDTTAPEGGDDAESSRRVAASHARWRKRPSRGEQSSPTRRLIRATDAKLTPPPSPRPTTQAGPKVGTPAESSSKCPAARSTPEAPLPQNPVYNSQYV